VVPRNVLPARIRASDGPPVRPPFADRKQTARQPASPPAQQPNSVSACRQAAAASQCALLPTRRNFRRRCPSTRCCDSQQKKPADQAPLLFEATCDSRIATNASFGRHASLPVTVLLDTSRVVRTYLRQALVTPRPGIRGRAASSRRCRLWYTAPATLSLARLPSLSVWESPHSSGSRLLDIVSETWLQRHPLCALCRAISSALDRRLTRAVNTVAMPNSTLPQQLAHG
jgi:hypothetical protein